MRFLHTSDWHLGQKFIGQSRDIEHGLALDWLLETIAAQQVDALIVAGDIFDVNNPPTSAETLYYQFLSRLVGSPCRHIIIIGGNHDAPSKLEAPKNLLQALGIHVIGKAAGPEEELILLKDQAGKPLALVAAIPFLRDRDFQGSISGEGMDDRIQRIKEGIYKHYHEMAACAQEILDTQKLDIPVLTTGHLYAKGAAATEEQANIYIGNLENIAAEQFPEIFDYVALGHIHRPQIVGKKQHIRYCGSLIPLSFSEIADKKLVLLCDVEHGKGLVNIQEIPVPTFRKLATVRGSLAEIEAKLQKLHDPASPLPAWVEIWVEGDQEVAALDRHLRDIAKDLNLELLKIRRQHGSAALDALTETEQLDALSLEDVFLKRCESLGLSSEATATLLQTFGELREWMDAVE